MIICTAAVVLNLIQLHSGTQFLKNFCFLFLGFAPNGFAVFLILKIMLRRKFYLQKLLRCKQAEKI